MNNLLRLLKRNWVFALILSTVLLGSVAYGKYLENNATSVSEVPSHFVCIHDDWEDIYTCFNRGDIK
jgi:hypothetical protein